jgi:radical SAM superfamily enzyme YgiQ (UPF0313 family)
MTQSGRAPDLRPFRDLTGVRIAFVSLADDVTCVGLRTLAALVERQGGEARVIHLPSRGDGAEWPARWLPAFCDLLEGSTFVAFSVMSIDVPRARRLSRHLRAQGLPPVVWGGPYPTLRPAECAEDADYVCVGEGEHYVNNLAEALRDGVPGWLPAAGEATPGAAPEHVELVPRLTLESTWILRRGELRPATRELYREVLTESPTSRDTFTIGYETVTSRGCPHSCSFCGSTALKEVQPGLFHRGRSVASIVEELERARELFPFVTGVGFADDNFLARSVSWLAEFAAQYKARIGLPFICLGSPATITPERMRLLVDAGLRRIKMGIQSGSGDVARVFDRVSLSKRLDQALGAIAEHHDRCLPPRFDFLVDLPFESLDDRMDTLRLLARLPRPYRLELNSLRLMEGTPLYDRAQREGWATPDMSVDFKRIAPTYTNLVLAMCREGALPGPLVGALGHERLVHTFSTGVPERVLRRAWLAARGARRAVREQRKHRGPA